LRNKERLDSRTQEARMPGSDIPSLPADALLSALPSDSVERLRERAQIVRLAAGEFLFHEGDSGESAYIVRAGRIEVLIDGQVIRTLRRGATIGELALLRRSARVASARAARDCELWRIDRAEFDRLIVEDHRFALALCRLLGSRLAEHRSPVLTPQPPRAVAIVPLEREVSARPFADQLVRELSAMGEAALRSAVSASDADNYAALFDRAEAASRWVVLCCEADPAHPWTQACLAEADRIIALTRGRPDVAWTRAPAALRGCDVLVFGTSNTRPLVRAIAPSAIRLVPDEGAMTRWAATTARRLAGRAVGVVLSGGGARALVHLGVLEELQAVGVRVDRVAGASMGAVVAAGFASGMDMATMNEEFHRGFVERNPSGDYTLPVFSLVRGRRTYRQLDELFGTTEIEELPLRFYCVSADLNNRTSVIHRSGPVRDAVFASLSIPGIFPPIPMPDGALLVDGGILDNLPVEPMAREAEGPVIAVDVTHVEPWRPRRGGGQPSWRGQALSLISGYDGDLPRLPETILRCLVLGSSDTVAAARRHADIVITPGVGGSLLDWRQLPKMREAGRAAVRRLLESDPDALARCM
jgi:predicted acylesterase/phospholipase RssA/CRP-like cAMP-binding protein